MKSRGCGLVQQIGMVDSATPHSDPSGGQAPALHFPWGDYRRFLDLAFCRGGFVRGFPPTRERRIRQRECRVRCDASWGRPVGVCRAPPWRFASRTYGVVGGWWDAGGQFWAGEFAVRLERGTSPSPRVVFDRATFPLPLPGLRPSPEWRIGTVNSATPQPNPSGGRAPPLRFPAPHPVIRSGSVGFHHIQMTRCTGPFNAEHG